MAVKVRAWVGCCLVLFGLVACGGISRVDHSGSANAAAGASFGGAGSGGQSGDESAGASAGRAAAGGSLGDLAACQPFKDQVPQPITVEIYNATKSWIFLGSKTPACGSAPLFGVRVYIDDVAPDQPEPVGCRATCQNHLDGIASDSCGGACPPSNIVVLGPGEAFVSEWSGLVDLDQFMPNECDALPGNPFGVGCRVGTRESPGTYLFHVEAGTDAVCGDGATACPDCVPDPRGGCTVAGATVIGNTFYGSVTVDLDERDGLTGPSGAPAAGAANLTRTVEIDVGNAQ